LEQPLPRSVIPPTGPNKVVLVFFVGGVTYAEIAAIRLLNQMNENVDYVIATTKTINGDTLLSSLLSAVEP